MEAESGLIKVFTGTAVVISMLKARLEEIGVGCLILNDFQTSEHSRFSVGTPSLVYLHIQESDFSKAQEIIDEFTINNPDYAV